MLCAPRALQIVTCGPTSGGIHSVPAIIDSTSRTPRRCGQASIARFEYGFGIHTSISMSWSGRVRYRNQLDAFGEIAQEAPPAIFSGYPTRSIGFGGGPSTAGPCSHAIADVLSAAPVSADRPTMRKFNRRHTFMRLRFNKTDSQQQLAVKLRVEPRRTPDFSPGSIGVCSFTPQKPRWPPPSAGGWRCASACTTATGAPSAPSSFCSPTSVPP